MPFVTSPTVKTFINKDKRDTPKAECAIAVAKYLYNARITSTLGIGSQGEAYLMSNGQVIKVTSDESEYYSSKLIAGKEIDHVNIIHRCVLVEFKGVKRYCIIQKYADQCHRSTLADFEQDTDAHDIVKNLINGYYDEDEFLEMMDDCYDRCEVDHEWLIPQYKGVGFGLLEAEYSGEDFFYRNTGWDKDREQIVMIDLGYSSEGIDEEEEEEVIAIPH